jgi:hypothetical protein
VACPLIKPGAITASPFERNATSPYTNPIMGNILYGNKNCGISTRAFAMPMKTSDEIKSSILRILDKKSLDTKYMKAYKATVRKT